MLGSLHCRHVKEIPTEQLPDELPSLCNTIARQSLLNIKIVWSPCIPTERRESRNGEGLMSLTNDLQSCSILLPSSCPQSSPQRFTVCHQFPRPLTHIVCCYMPHGCSAQHTVMSTVTCTQSNTAHELTEAHGYRHHHTANQHIASAQRSVPLAVAVAL